MDLPVGDEDRAADAAGATSERASFKAAKALVRGRFFLAVVADFDDARLNAGEFGEGGR